MSNQDPNAQQPNATQTQVAATPGTPATKAPTEPPTPKGSSKIRGNITKELMEKEFVNPEEKTRCLANAIWHATKEHSFLGTILQCLNISYVHTIPTAGVMFNNDMKRWDLLINPFFFCKKLNDPQRTAVLIHELYHITNKHPFRAPFMKLAARRRILMNVAADMAINQFIKDLPKGCQSCPDPTKGPAKCTNEMCPGKCIDVADFYDTDDQGNRKMWPKAKTMEDYYELLIKRFDDPDNEDDDEGDGEGALSGLTGGDGVPDTIDEHIWDGSAEEKDMLEATEDLVKRAMIKERLDYDNLPGSIKELLQEIEVRKAELNYRALINSAIKKNASGHERKRTWTRVSRRFGPKAPGTKVGDLPKLQMYIDTSGSISIEEANEFLDIVDNFLKNGTRKCRLNLFHTDNYYSEEYKLGSRLDKSQIQSGGTDLTESFKDIWKRRPDLAIFLTDGCYGDVPVEQWMKPADKFPQCLFIISKNGSEKHPLERLGQTIKIPNGK